MILVDTNLLIYATQADSDWHEACRGWLENQINANTQIGLPWLVTIAFLRITTNPRIFPKPLEVDEVIQQMQSWFELPNVHPLEPTEKHWITLRRLLLKSGSAGNLTNDAHLAAIAIDHGALLCSADNDFRRFEGLQHHNPLQDDSVHEPALAY